jgi:flagellin
MDARFQLTGVTISGTGINTAQKFVDAVNDFSNSTGVIARIKAGTTADIEFVAEDGRNIQLILTAQSYTAGSTSTFAQALFDDAANVGTMSQVGSWFTTGGTLFSQGGTFLRSGSIKLISSQDINITGPSSTSLLGFTQGNYAVNKNSAINKIDLTSADGAADALAVVDAALQQVTALRADLGAVQNRLESTSNNISVTLENISAARSQIVDADIAAETAELTRSQILQQAGVAVLGQANAASQIALSLLRF